MKTSPVVLVAVGGGIAAYKSAELVSALARHGMEVHVALTEAGAKFVGPTTFASLSRRRVLMDMFPDPKATEGEALFPHLYPAQHADLFVLAPATANLMAKIAHGIADDVVSAAALALPATAKKVFCPAMNTRMWENPVTRENVARMERHGWMRLGPAEGSLACGTTGPGRMIEAADIVRGVCALLQPAASLGGRRVLILSGPTREHLDPVRYIGNRSSGRMGAALALEASSRGAHVVFITGPVESSRRPEAAGIDVVPVVSANDMLEAAKARLADCDIVIHAAAVSDYAPARISGKKLPKSKESVALELRPTPDIATTLTSLRRPNQMAVGFALESEGGRAQAEAKLKAKRFDFIILNGPESMDADAAAFEYKPAGGAWQNWGRLCKRECAARIWDCVAGRLPGTKRRSPAKRTA